MTAPLWNPVWERESFTLQCQVQLNNRRNVTDIRYLFIKDGKELESAGPPGNYTTPAARAEDAGRYECQLEAGGVRKASDSVQVNVRDASVILQTPPQPLTEGDKLTLLCRARDTKVDPKHITFEYYKNSETLEFQPSTGVTIPAVMKKDAGLYKCFAYSKGRVLGESEVEVSVRNFFARVTLTASPGPAVLEGEPVNLTCEVERNTYLSPPVNYTFLRDGAPLAASSGTAQYFITAMNKTHTGRYSCTVETWPGIRKQSAAVKIELASKAVH
ncbi:Fc receptor-like protein 2 [Acipenser ruthenus]|uniref:Fc receptor-like protein 2 n=1 Tax=Acipenser ruthenus TaxID=7906 RepID=A0A662YKL3_ACIRT|nr:Fc receptor-like protein 2 [Acipenser ruthenus]